MPVRRVPSRLEQFIGDRLTRQRIRFTAAATIIIGSLLLIFSFATTQDNRTGTGLGLGSDWLAFYNAGTIANRFGGSQLYDLDLQANLYHEVLPGEPDGVQLPYANAPFLVVVLGPLALLPYHLSYAAWVGISVLLFAGGLMLLWSTTGTLSRYRSIAVLLAFSFEPFVIECLHGGQISVIGLFALCATLYFSRTSRPFLSGCCLAICTYKPTLLPLILPMLVLMRQWNILMGFATGATLLGAVSLLMVGPQACFDYAHLLIGYAGRTSSGSSGGLQLPKFVDLNSFLKLLQIPAPIIWMALLITGAALARAMWRVRPQDDSDASRHLSLAWAVAITWTIVLNLYVGVYDSILIMPAIVLTAESLLRRSGDAAQNLPLRFRCLLLAVWTLPWVSGILARDMGFQPFTLALLALAIYQLQLLRNRVRNQGNPSPIAQRRHRDGILERAQWRSSPAAG